MKPDRVKEARPVRLFVSYSHENAVWCKRLLPVLRVKANVDALQAWHDTELRAGDRWDKEIQAELERMDIFLCLVSYQFLASDYIQSVELPRAKARHENGEIEVVPVVLYPMDLMHDCEFLYPLNPLPEWGKSWRDFEKDGDWNDALYPIGNGLKQALEKVRSRPGRYTPSLSGASLSQEISVMPSAGTVTARASQLNSPPIVVPAVSARSWWRFWR